MTANCSNSSELLVTDTGTIAVSRDQFEMMVFRLHKGDHDTVLCGPADAGIATIDIGLWPWQQPVFFCFGFIFLCMPGLLLSRLEPAQKPGLKQ